MWWNPRDVLSYNKLFSFVVGQRGGGKTYGSKKLVINNFIRKGEQFIYLRRWKTEFQDLNLFFADVMHEYPEHTFEVKGKKLFIDGQLAGFAIALSTALQKKSTSFRQVSYIIYDEFVIDSKVIHYMSNEVVSFLEFYETVNRLRLDDQGEVDHKQEVRVLFLSNAVSVVNPYFSFFGLRPDNKKRFTKYDNMIVEFYKNADFIEKKLKTQFGQIIANTTYGNYAINNEFLKDNDTFVEKRTSNARHRFIIIHKGVSYGVWADYNVGIIHISRDIDPSCRMVYTLSSADHQYNVMLLSNARQSHNMKTILNAYEKGYLRFADLETKNQLLEVLQTMGAS